MTFCRAASSGDACSTSNSVYEHNITKWSSFTFIYFFGFVDKQKFIIDVVLISTFSLINIHKCDQLANWQIGANLEIVKDIQPKHGS